MKVHEFMVSKIEFIDSDRTVYDAVEIMVDKRIRSLVIRVGGKSDREAVDGVVTARDIVFKVLAKGLNPKAVKVADIASRPLACVEKDMDFDDAATLMEKANIARLFVCDGEKVVGVVSLLDVMAAELIMWARGDYDSR
ncbi:MAG TPA: CBS domain-containing protein [Syntrophobacteraceae bacterium]|nr:CBS domain-containing protein [Syntrophobacteraceae bacterium]